MRSNLFSSIVLTALCILFFAGAYPVVVWGIAQIAPNKGKGFTTESNHKTYYTNIGQKFTEDRYFWSRPSAVDYNAAGSGGSNKGPSNSEYLALVQARIDSFVAHNPGIDRKDIPADVVTASGSGLDPDISLQAALVQVPRIAKVRSLSEVSVKNLVQEQLSKPLAGIAGPERINVLELNLKLDKLSATGQKPA